MLAAGKSFHELSHANSETTLSEQAQVYTPFRNFNIHDSHSVTQHAWLAADSAGGVWDKRPICKSESQDMLILSKSCGLCT